MRTVYQCLILCFVLVGKMIMRLVPCPRLSWAWSNAVSRTTCLLKSKHGTQPTPTVIPAKAGIQSFLYCLLMILMFISESVFAANEFAVHLSAQQQLLPDVDDGIIVWQQYVEFENAWDWDILGIDLNDINAPVPIDVAVFNADQTNPAVWNTTVVWQDNDTNDGDWNIWMADITDANIPQYYPLDEFQADQTRPAIHGHIAVWQDDYNPGNSDLYAADISDPANPYLFEVDTFDKNQAAPAIYRNTIVYQDDTYGDWDVMSADVWLKNVPTYTWIVADTESLNQTHLAVTDKTLVWQQETTTGNSDIKAADISDPANPIEFIVADGAADQTAPDISGHLVVWQDDRNGHWDIYGYNLITRKEFRITADPANQTNPAISGNLVVWEHTPAGGVSNIYAAYLEESDIADCPTPLAGDIDGDCRVTLSDFMAVAENWLTCNLEPIEACTN